MDEIGQMDVNVQNQAQWTELDVLSKIKHIHNGRNWTIWTIKGMD